MGVMEWLEKKASDVFRQVSDLLADEAPASQATYTRGRTARGSAPPPKKPTTSEPKHPLDMQMQAAFARSAGQAEQSGKPVAISLGKLLSGIPTLRDAVTVLPAEDGDDRTASTELQHMSLPNGAGLVIELSPGNNENPEMNVRFSSGEARDRREITLSGYCLNVGEKGPVFAIRTVTYAGERNGRGFEEKHPADRDSVMAALAAISSAFDSPKAQSDGPRRDFG